MPSPVQAFRSIEEEIQALRGLPEAASFPESVGRTLKESYLRGIKAPLAVGGAALGEGMDLLSDTMSELQKGVNAKAATPGKVGGPSQEWFEKRGQVSTPAKPPEIPTEEINIPVPKDTSLRAVRDASGRVTFTNFDQPDKQEIDYEATTAALRPAGRQAGGVSSPVLRDDQGRPTMVPDYDLERTRGLEVADLAHKATVQQLTDQANPQARVMRDVEAATQIANLFKTPDAELEAGIQAAIKLYAARENMRPEDVPAEIQAFLGQRVRDDARKQSLSAFQEYLNKERYPGPTLAGYGNQLRGEAADITSR